MSTTPFVATSTDSVIYSPDDPIFSQPSPPLQPPHRTCGKYAKGRKRCAGCGKTIKASLMRCHDAYLCNNCASGRVISWAWLKTRDVSHLKTLRQVAVELSLPRDPTSTDRANEDRLVALAKQLTPALSLTSAVRMAALPTNHAQFTTLRIIWVGDLRWDQISRAWKAIAGESAFVSALRRFIPDDPNYRLCDIFKWVMAGMEPIALLTEEERQGVKGRFRGSRRINSCGPDYKRLSKAELERRKAEYQARKGEDSCPCCGELMVTMAEEDQVPMTIEDLQEKYPDCHIVIHEDYNPFDVAPKDVSIAPYINFFAGESRMVTESARAGPS